MTLAKYLLDQFFFNYLVDWCVFRDGSIPASGDKFVICYDVLVTRMIVFSYDVKSGFFTDKSARALGLAAAAVIAFASAITADPIHETFLSVSYQVRAFSFAFHRLVSSIYEQALTN